MDSQKLNEVSIAIPTFLRDGYLVECVKRIQENLPECQLIIIDDGHMTPDKVSLYERLQDEGVTVELLSFDSGLPAKRNAAAEVCETKYLLMGTDDFNFAPPEVRTGILKFIDKLDSDDSIDVVSGRFKNYKYEGFLEYVPGSHIKETRLVEDGSDSYVVDITVNYWMIRPELLLEVPQDNRMKIGGEHGDWFLSLKEAGKKVVWIPGININDLPVDKMAESPEYQKFRDRAWGLGHTVFLNKRNIKTYYGFDDSPKTNCVSSKDIIQGLWIGDSLTPMEQLSIKSFLKQGHQFHLYTYGNVKGIPAGTVVLDANEIIPRSLRDYSKFSSLGAFSDFFRYKLLLDKGGWWSDLDSICLKPFDFKLSYVFSSEAKMGKKPGQETNAGTIKAPAGCELLRYCWSACLEKNPSSIEWASVGPALLKKAVEKFSLSQYVQKPEIFCSVHWQDLKRLVDPLSAIEISEDAHAIHLWNEMWRDHGLSKFNCPVGSTYDNLRVFVSSDEITFTQTDCVDSDFDLVFKSIRLE